MKLEWTNQQQPSTLGLAPIPWSDCWDQPGFNACADNAFAQAQRDCVNYNPNRYNSREECESQTKDVYVSSDCLKFCKPTAATYRGADPCNSAAAVAYMQKQLGVTSDGKFGPNTRNALTSSGHTMQGLIGCTGPCPASVPAGLCAGDCLPGFSRSPVNGRCERTGPGPSPAPGPIARKSSNRGIWLVLVPLAGLAAWGYTKI
jgi:hypothetical protein